MCKVRIVLFISISVLLMCSNSYSGPWDDLSEIEFNQQLVSTNYRYKIDVFVPQEGTANYKRWKSDAVISYVIFKSNKRGASQKDLSKPIVQFWNLAISTLKSNIAVKNAPSPFISNDAKRLAYIDNTNLKINNFETKIEETSNLKSSSLKDKIIIGGWSPDGLKISLYNDSEESGKLWVFESDKKKLNT